MKFKLLTLAILAFGITVANAQDSTKVKHHVHHMAKKAGTTADTTAKKMKKTKP